MEKPSEPGIVREIRRRVQGGAGSARERREERASRRIKRIKWE